MDWHLLTDPCQIGLSLINLHLTLSVNTVQVPCLTIMLLNRWVAAPLTNTIQGQRKTGPHAY